MQNKIKCDLLVIGGGISGIAAAYFGACRGLDVILVEKNNYLGGLITGGLVIPSMKADNNGINQEFFEDLISYSKKYNAHITYGDNNKGWFNPVTLKAVFDNMLKDAGCKILFEAKPICYKKLKNNIVEVEIKHKLLSLYIESKYYIDATGDGNFSEVLNCEFLKDSAINQPCSLRFIMGGVNLKTFGKFIMNLDPDRNTTTYYEINGAPHLSTAYTWDKNRHFALEPYFKEAINKGILKEEDTDYFQVFTVASMPNSLAFNCPRIKVNDPKSPFDASLGLIEARNYIYRMLKFCKKYLKGFKNAYISNIADMTGTREFRRVKCKYTYKLNDILNEKKFKNPVLYSNYPIDVHSNKKNGSILKQVKGYYLPIESLMSANYNNLFIIGRCLGAEYQAQGALRVQNSCASMGVGVAKYIINNLK